jgi:hypothetical protein
MFAKDVKASVAVVGTVFGFSLGLRSGLVG